MQSTIARKGQVAGILERICQGLEISDTQYEQARSRYESVGRWLADSSNPLLKDLQIYPQGSISIGTTVKPLKQNEFDIDLVSHAPNMSVSLPPHVLKRSIGERLKLNNLYVDKIEEKPRCWRINYANDFHLDITPSIPNPESLHQGELVPDKIVQDWKESNPKGFKDWFSEVAKLQPRSRLLRSMQFANASVERLPDNPKLKGILRRSVQVCKHHRDRYFDENQNKHLSPISVILTTLAAKSYKYCVTSFEYDSDLDILLDVLKYMPNFIEIAQSTAGPAYYIWNPTTTNENFAEKWNHNPALAIGFYQWHVNAMTTLQGFIGATGIDVLKKSMNSCFSEGVVSSAFSAFTNSINEARRDGTLSIVSGLGLGISGKTAIPKNTFFGN